MSSLPSSFNNVGIDQAAWWVKSKRFNDNGNEVYQTIDNNGQQQRFTTTPDGSNLVECSADGDTWSAC